MKDMTYFNSNIDIEKKKERFEKLKKRRGAITITVIILLLISAMNMLSSAFYMKPGNIKKHLVYILLFIIVYAVVGNINIVTRFIGRVFSQKNLSFGYKILSNRKLNIAIFLFSMFVLGGMLVGIKLGVSFIPKINGTYGWINLGPISIQPAEILKCAFVINLANCLSKAEDRDLSEGTIIVTSLIYLFAYGILIFGQGDLGSIVHYFSIWLLMVFMTKIRGTWIVGGFAFIGVIGVAVVTYIYKFLSIESASYRSMRIKHYIDGLFTGSYNDDYGYQIKQSIYAFGSGGFFGKGYANGVQKYTYLPEIHTDFIMATFGEEFGMTGMLFIVVLFFVLYYLCIATARDSKNYFGKFLAIGFGALIISQVMINIFVVTGLLPVFGIPMPFFSYGGSSMITLAVALGLICNINIE